MKKYLSIALLTIFIIPSVASAAWWNPFTWKIFQKKDVAVEQVVPVISEELLLEPQEQEVVAEQVVPVISKESLPEPQEQEIVTKQEYVPGEITFGIPDEIWIELQQVHKEFEKREDLKDLTTMGELESEAPELKRRLDEVNSKIVQVWLENEQEIEIKLNAITIKTENLGNEFKIKAEEINSNPDYTDEDTERIISELWNSYKSDYYTLQQEAQIIKNTQWNIWTLVPDYQLYVNE